MCPVTYGDVVSVELTSMALPWVRISSPMVYFLHDFVTPVTPRLLSHRVTILERVVFPFVCRRRTTYEVQEVPNSTTPVLKNTTGGMRMSFHLGGVYDGLGNTNKGHFVYWGRGTVSNFKRQSDGSPKFQPPKLSSMIHKIPSSDKIKQKGFITLPDIVLYIT